MLRRIILCLSVGLNIGGVIGLFTLPEDIPVALQRLGAIAMWLDRETILIGLFGLSSLSFGWVVFQPSVSKWLERRRSPELKIDYQNDINEEAKYGIYKRSTIFLPMDGDDTWPFKQSRYFIGIYNTTQKTIRRVSVVLETIANPMTGFHNSPLLSDPNKTATVDIAPACYFLFGYRQEDGGQGKSVIAEHHKTVSGLQAEKMRKEWPDRDAFRILVSENGYVPILPNNGTRVVIAVSGDDIALRRHQFTLNFRPRFELLYDGLGKS